MMLLSVVFPLRPRQEAVIPADQGRALAAEFLRWVQACDPALSAALHDANALRPYTVSGLRGASPHNGQVRLRPDRPVWWRLTTLTPTLSQVVRERVLPSLPPTVTLGEAVFERLPPLLTAAEHPWAGQTTYEELAAGALLQARRPRRLTLHFASPTTFHSRERHQPFPLPELVFRQWLEKWNAFAPAAFPPGVLTFVEEALAVSHYRLESRVVRFGEALFIGFSGHCTYRFLVTDAYWQRVVQALAQYAFFCGTGAKTVFGLGQTRLLVPAEASSVSGFSP
jgi:CRISPR-associated endoribonuclease Cas6